MAKKQGETAQTFAMAMLVALGVGVGFIVLNSWVLPMLFGVTLTGIFSTVGSKLSTLGGPLGGIVGAAGEIFLNFSVFFVQPALNGNPFAIVGLAGWLLMVSVFLVHLYKDEPIIQ